MRPFRAGGAGGTDVTRQHVTGGCLACERRRGWGSESPSLRLPVQHRVDLNATQPTHPRQLDRRCRIPANHFPYYRG
jgi:hypothetical protein